MSRVVVFAPRKFEDHRGWFTETFNAQREAEIGIPHAFVQDNLSHSLSAGTIRGIHFQRPPHAQAKLVRCNKGQLIDYVVDLRRGSPTYGHHASIELSAQNLRQVFIPIGFGHAFVTLGAGTEIAYKVTDYFSPESDDGIRWDCPSVNIAWPVSADEAIVSERDQRFCTLSDFDSPFDYDGIPLEPISVPSD